MYLFKAPIQSCAPVQPFLTGGFRWLRIEFPDRWNFSYSVLTHALPRPASGLLHPETHISSQGPTQSPRCFDLGFGALVLSPANVDFTVERKQFIYFFVEQKSRLWQFRLRSGPVSKLYNAMKVRERTVERARL